MSDSANPVNWFEIPVSDLDRATKFYEKVFGFTMTPMEMGPSKMAMFPWTQGGTNAAGALLKSEGYTPSHSGSMVYFSVADIEGTLKKAGESGVKTLVPKWGIGEHGFVAHFEDCEGNRVGVHSMS
jgi:predicted enzyme related to lactoylglutathione lyase